MWGISIFRKVARELRRRCEDQRKMQRCEKQGEKRLIFQKEDKRGKKREFHLQISISSVHCEKQFEYRQSG